MAIRGNNEQLRTQIALESSRQVRIEKVDIFSTLLSSFGQCENAGPRRFRKTNRVSGNYYSSSSFDWLCFWGSAGTSDPSIDSQKMLSRSKSQSQYSVVEHVHDRNQMKQSAQKTVLEILKVLPKVLQIPNEKLEALQ